MLHQYVLARHTKVGSAILHISRHIRRADNHQLHIIAIGIQNQLAAIFRIVQRFDADCPQQWHGILEDAPFGQRDSDGVFTVFHLLSIQLIR